MKIRPVLTVIATLVLASAATPSAAADGLPVPVDYTFGEGVVSSDGSSRFVTIDAGSQTVLVETSTESGEITAHSLIDGQFTVPAIAVDGTASGVSADGETLALINPRKTFPRQTTELVVYDVAQRIKDAQRIELKGDFSFDALSPDGETLYLVEYTDPRDPGAYQVRQYDLASGALAPDPILDTEEEPGEMRGFPQTRLTGPGGTWEYTLYDGGEHPFIHALNVVEATTLCIDLDMIHARNTYGAKLELSADESSIELVDRKGELRAIVDTETHEASAPGAEPAPTAAPAPEKTPALVPAGIAAGGLILTALAALGIRRMRN